MRGSERFAQRLKGKLTPEQIAFVERAYEFAKEKHKGQFRDGGERVFEHPRGVALIVVLELNIYDPEMIAAAFLHDVLEDCPDVSWREIETKFGHGTYRLVKLVTKEKGLSPEQELEYFKGFKFYEWRERVLKLCDRLHNIRTLHSCTRKKQRRYLKETYEVFIPLAGETNAYLCTELSKACAQVEVQLVSTKRSPQATVFF